MRNLYLLISVVSISAFIACNTGEGLNHDKAKETLTQYYKRSLKQVKSVDEVLIDSLVAITDKQQLLNELTEAQTNKKRPAIAGPS